MSCTLALVFWVSSLLAVYPYLIYPPLLYLLARLSPVRSQPREVEDSPRVTLIISAYNEEAVIAEKLRNALELDYPPHRIDVIVVSDGSTDRTNEIVQQLSAQRSRIRLMRQSERRGKSIGLNEAVAAARGEIVVFSDANAMYEPGSIRELVSGFADRRVGYVVGAALYGDAKGNRAAESEGLYWRFEMFLKHLESDYYSVIGGDGAIYAIRRELFRDLQFDDISDFVNPLQIVAAGYLGRFNSKARCFENTGDTFKKEFQRKKRIVNRTWRAVRRYGGTLSFAAHRRFIFMLLSHKVIRWFTLPLIVLAWASNTALLGTSSLYILTWTVISGSIVAAGLGAGLDRKGRRPPRLVSASYYFYLVSMAALLGIWDDWRGARYATWDHIRTSKT